MQHNISLPGHGVRLVPLRRRHAADLFPYIDADMWAGMASEQPSSKRALDRLFASRIADPAIIAFAVIDEETGTVAGTTSLYDYVPEQSRVELGMTFFGRNYWGRNVNAASKLALLGFAFEELLVHRVTLRCDMRNSRSAAAIVKLGATFEGVLRGYRRGHDGTRVDTGLYSILEHEWPQSRSSLVQRLTPADLLPEVTEIIEFSEQLVRADAGGAPLPA
ncbi:RimJ/RimL family protein N-acetyltransferase [Arthrobacter silviterrae]|uniref:GNAT family N-acetyltransferase n=1 Tax=Arthrobacter TaxID=1663 RepID=UPI0021CDE204|nr:MULTISPECIES: GNAT family protein [Arthrobacter]MCU6479505.1 GNAT family N-acetyltransferase [Arthrobacter sp. A2-55]MDQ0279672.1 RimJ/RimL family protein N-acetyltransferase [Arthrobacter silviterrae]